LIWRLFWSRVRAARLRASSVPGGPLASIERIIARRSSGDAFAISVSVMRFTWEIASTLPLICGGWLGGLEQRERNSGGRVAGAVRMTHKELGREDMSGGGRGGY
jgi:hypothetical protein